MFKKITLYITDGIVLGQGFPKVATSPILALCFDVFNHGPSQFIIMKPILFTLFLWLCCLYTTTAQTRQIDSLALVGLYQSTNGAQWTQPWNLNQPMDTWIGVNLTTTTGRVLSIDLSNRGLTGILPSQLNLSQANVLSLAYNSITGSIPNWRTIPQLVSLNLSNNQFSGAIANFSHFPNLEIIDLQQNRLSGTIPDFGSMPKLLYLVLAWNRLSGPVPDFSNLPQLTILGLQSNRLSGNIPNFSNLPALELCSLSDNAFGGAIPDFSNLAFLKDLYVDRNKLTGSLPNFSNLPSLEILVTRNNILSGSIPDFDGLPLLKYLWINNNQLTGSIPNLRDCPNLEILELGKNKLEGRVPIFSTATQLERVSIEENRFTFEDIVPGHTALTTKINGNNTGAILTGYFYRDQEAIGPTEQVTLTAGATYTLDLGIDAGLASNVYYWYKDGVFVDSVIGNNTYTITNFQATDAGQYSAQVTNTIVTEPAEYRQDLVLQSRVFTLDFGTAIAINKIATINPLVAYPNPTFNVVQIDLPNNPTGARLQLINAVGQVLYQETIPAQTTNKRLALQAYPVGIYWIRLSTTTGNVWQTNVVKQ